MIGYSPHIIHSHRHGVSLGLVPPINEPPARAKRLNGLIDLMIMNKGLKHQRINYLFGGQWYFIVSKNSLKLVSSTLVSPSENLDITLNTRGFLAEFGPRNKIEKVSFIFINFVVFGYFSFYLICIDEDGSVINSIIYD